MSAPVAVDMDAETTELAQAWDEGEQHPSDQHRRGIKSCYPHASCNPHSSAALHAAFAAGCAAEENYVGVFGQFNPTGHLGNVYRYPRPPLFTAAEATAVLDLHRDGVGTRKIAGRLRLNRVIVQTILRDHRTAPENSTDQMKDRP